VRPSDGGPLSPARAAGLVGVSESTLKRWVDAGLLRAGKTAGGHRRIAPQDLLAFLRGTGRSAPSLEALGLMTAQGRRRAPSTPLSPESLGDLLLEDVASARRLLLDAYTTGQPIDELGDRILAPAMTRIGAMWAQGVIDVAQEHLVTQRLSALLAELRGLLASPASGAPRATGGAPEGDPYVLPSLLVELTLLELGWHVLNLGPETPMSALAAAVRRHQPRLVWISITTQHPAPAFLEEYGALVDAKRAARAGVIVGGQGLTVELQSQLVPATFGTRLLHLKEFARSLAKTGEPGTPYRIEA
jgi:excisionase family DNA binding protein